MLPPTSPRLFDPDAVPYFLWDLRLNVAQVKRTLATGAAEEKDELVVRLLREANSRDVWVFLDWPAIEDAWPRIAHRLGRARGVWQLMLDHHQRHGRRAPTP